MLEDEAMNFSSDFFPAPYLQVYTHLATVSMVTKLVVCVFITATMNGTRSAILCQTEMSYQVRFVEGEHMTHCFFK